MPAAARSGAFSKHKTKLDVELNLRLGLAAIPQFCKDNYWKSLKFEADESCLVCAGRQLFEMRPGVAEAA